MAAKSYLPLALVLALALPLGAEAPPPPSPAAQFSSLLEEARNLLRDCRAQESLELLDRATALKPEHPAPWVYRFGACSMLASETRKPSWKAEARRCLSEARRRTESMSEEKATAEDLFWMGQVWGLLAVRHGEQDEWLKAARNGKRMREAGRRAQRLDPEFADAYVLTGLYDYMAAELPSFVKVLRFFLFLPGGDRERGIESLRLARREGRLASRQAGIILQQILVHEGRLDQAVELGRAMLEEDPADGPAALRLARALAWAGEPLSAARVLEGPARGEAACLQEDDVWETKLLRAILLLRGDRAQASLAALEMLPIDEEELDIALPASRVTLAHRARAAALDALGRRQEAAELCRGALDRDSLSEKDRAAYEACIQGPVTVEELPAWL